MERNIVVISAGLGSPSSSRLLADQLQTASIAELAQRGEQSNIRLVELRDLAVDIANNLVTGYAPPALQEVIGAVQDADGLIVVTPVFSASFSGLFKSFFDLVDPKSLQGTPVVLAATGGTARHSMVIDFALRPLFGYLRAAIVPTGVYAAPDDWGDAGLNQRVSQAAAEFAEALHGNPPRRPSRSMESLPFEQLLANIGEQN
ncbi:FMN reductase [Psychromicrobium lacuslunae]|uniref:NADPH-dependent FMN reductase n=1 Tax=Psychromicrobium lacuslunae TaxID=1618207 RepID=A0A0D4C2V4_9MICC|nr:FMN reductase [Psychromicrobium lacuslunae]AJT42691.1 NADPH-dependent FMN reductase [Psychromicrobium lacuslunae]